MVNDSEKGVYVASRASVPERPAHWRQLREQGLRITSSWIDETSPACMGVLWQTIEQEIAASAGVLLYAETDDFPLRGALIECGLALGMGKPVALVLPGVDVDLSSYRPIGSWIAHPRVQRFEGVKEAYRWLQQGAPPR